MGARLLQYVTMRNRFIALDGAAKSVNRELEAKARDLAGLKGYVTNLAACIKDGRVTDIWTQLGRRWF